MVSWKRILIPMVSALGLFACNRPDPVDPGSNGASGSARVALPALPSGYLAGAATARLVLDVTGPGMIPIYFEKTLYEGTPTTLELNGIPPGQRVFHGVLLRVDSTGWDTSATHEGWTSAQIVGGATANVALFLKSTASGSAHVCLQVEGWPAADTTCGGQPPPPPPVPSLAGCYRLTVTKHGPRQDTLFQAKLRILSQNDSTLFAVATWKSGAQDSALGYSMPGGEFYFGYRVGQFQFKGLIDTAEGSLRGYFQDSARGIFGDAVAFAAPCDTVTPPPPPPDSMSLDSLLCWGVSQSTVDGRNLTGTLWAGWRGSSVRAWFQWSDLSAFSMDNGTVPAGGSSTLYLFGTLPGGFGHPARSALEMGHYKAKLNLGGALQNGAAYARAGGTTDFTGADKFADWSGAPMACPDQARRMVAGLFR